MLNVRIYSFYGMSFRFGIAHFLICLAISGIFNGQKLGISKKDNSDASYSALIPYLCWCLPRRRTVLQKLVYKSVECAL